MQPYIIAIVILASLLFVAVLFACFGDIASMYGCVLGGLVGFGMGVYYPCLSRYCRILYGANLSEGCRTICE